MPHSSSPRKPACLEAPVLFDLAQTLGSGQVFHWNPDGAGYCGVIGGRQVRVEQRGNLLLLTPGMQKEVRHYFALDHPLEEIQRTFPTDPAMQAALGFCRGLRIIRQPAWECLATFITSSMKQVSHIRQMSLALRSRFGRPVQNLEGVPDQFAYPTPERLARASEQELSECKLGYRARHLLGTARRIADGSADLDRIGTMDDAEVLEALCGLPGVGVKVANCVLLFGYGRLGAFPIDVWIGRVLRETYFKRKRTVTPALLRDFAHDYFGPFGGYAQQYLFHHARMTARQSRH